MNVLKAAPLDAAGLTKAMRPFWTASAVTPDEVAGDLADRGWVGQDGDGRYALTPRGEAAHAAVAGRVQATRRLVLDGLTREDYHTTVRMLRRMAEHLEGPLDR